MHAGTCAQGAVLLAGARGLYLGRHGRKALRHRGGQARRFLAHLARIGAEGKVEDGLFPSTYKVDYALARTPFVSILIPNKDHTEDLDKALRSIFEKTDYPAYEVIIIENNSTQPQTFAYYEKNRAGRYLFRCRVVRYGGGFNFSAINNFGRKAAKGEFLLLLNNDVEVISPRGSQR